VVGILAAGCPGLDALNPVCQLAGGVSQTVIGRGANAVFSAVAGWVVDGASWLLAQIGSVLNATTSVDITASWFAAHYQLMLGLLGVVALPLVLGAAIQALLRQAPTLLLRSLFVQLPLAIVLAGVAVQVVHLALAATDALSAAVAQGSDRSTDQVLSGVANGLVSAGNQGVPAFVVLLGALIVALGAFVIWVELLVRAAAIYVAVLFLPLALITLVWPAVSHWCRRLVDTLAALILSKFVIVAILSLAVGALSSGTAGSGGAGAGFASVLGGAALLLVAAFSPYTLLRLIPMIEAGAVMQLESARHSLGRAALGAPRSAASFALRHAPAEGLALPSPGTGQSSDLEAPGSERGSGPSGDEDLVGGVPMWRGIPGSETEVLARLSMAREGPIGADGRDRRGPRPIVAAPSKADRGTHVLGNDHMGPVIRWVPPTEPGSDGG
jgi:type IV secretion system protein TrbL